MTDGAKRIGLISDTHGLRRKEGVEALRGSEMIIHAGDVGKPEILEDLRKIAPVVAVRGNVDAAEWAKALPQTAVARAGADADLRPARCEGVGLESGRSRLSHGRQRAYPQTRNDGARRRAVHQPGKRRASPVSIAGDCGASELRTDPL